MPATQPIPPDVAGHDPKLDVRDAVRSGGRQGAARQVRLRRPRRRRLARPARRQAAVLSMASPPTGRDREYDELWQKKHERASACSIEFVKQKWPDLLKMGKRRAAADVAGRLDQRVRARATRSCSSLYGHNIGQIELLALPECRVRRALSQVADACPTVPSATCSTARWPRSSPPISRGRRRLPIENTLVKPWVVGYKKDASWSQPWRFWTSISRDEAAAPQQECDRTRALRLRRVALHRAAVASAQPQRTVESTVVTQLRRKHATPHEHHHS